MTKIANLPLKNQEWKKLALALAGEVHTDALHQHIYSTDASVYRNIPLAVAFPKNEQDLIALVKFAKKQQLSITPRAAGTSLAGQSIGKGMVVDISKYFTQILQLDVENKQVKVQPGVVLDELNAFLKPHGLFFSPTTSTANRCTIGGMFGNNSSGTTSIKYGVTRDKIVASRAVLSDATVVEFKKISTLEWEAKAKKATLEGEIYKTLLAMKKEEELMASIQANFPSPKIHRRNTGYALDELFLNETEGIQLNKLLAGSEGTLCIATEITLALDDLPPAMSSLVAAQFRSIEDALEAVTVAMKHDLYACEMMDKTILDCTQHQLYYQHHRFFIQEDPAAILLLELKAPTEAHLKPQVDALLEDLQKHTAAYATPVLRGMESEKAFELRKAGLGLLGNINGDKKAIACIEDTAVAVEDLKDYIQEFTALMKSYGQEAVYYAHAGAGELHLRPILNLKKSEDVAYFKEITSSVAQLVKKYKGSLSGEHGDGKVRSSFIPMMIGDTCYTALKKIKSTFDAQGIFNPHTILQPLPIEQDLRYKADREEPIIDTLLSFQEEGGLLRAAEKCNGSGDCRKSFKAGGGMCPSYHVTKNEKDTTRARANALREYLTHGTKPSNFHHEELREVFDLCVGCKACKSECPSNVDATAFKTELLYQYRKNHRTSIRDWGFANIDQINRVLVPFSSFYNGLARSKMVRWVADKTLGISQDRSLPILAKTPLFQLIKKQRIPLKPSGKIKQVVYLFIDEFTNYYDVEIGKNTLELLVKLDYEVRVLPHRPSGRALFSKGFLQEAKQLADFNIQLYKDKVSSQTPLLGIEPSAIFSFKDEYVKIADDVTAAKEIAKHSMLVEEFLAHEIASGNIEAAQFTSEKKNLKVHIHCHQKALSSMLPTFQLLNLPTNYDVKIISSGCCGMAGSFGYEKEHFDVSRQMANLQLIPAVQKAEKSALMVANGHSCRHQIKDLTGSIALHPLQIMHASLV